MKTGTEKEIQKEKPKQERNEKYKWRNQNNNGNKDRKQKQKRIKLMPQFPITAGRHGFVFYKNLGEIVDIRNATGNCNGPN